VILKDRIIHESERTEGMFVTNLRHYPRILLEKGENTGSK
jgi:hypothetical protein